MKNNNLILGAFLAITAILFSSCGASSTEITIGTQVWASKNLNVETYRNGDVIPQVQDQVAWSKLTTGAWCYYNNDASNGTKYGKLYNWYAVNDPRGIAPKGYHIPTDADWTKLTDYLGGVSEAGTKMKSNGGWNNNGNGTNSSGFSGLPGCFRISDGTFSNIDGIGGWWSSTEFSTDIAWHRYLNYDSGNADRSGNDKNYGFSVRCLKDIGTEKVEGSTESPSTEKVESSTETVNLVTIGSQIWTSKNLNVETYRNGDVIPQVQDQNAWANLTTGAWCYFGNDASFGTSYGKLYNWYAVHDPRGLAPNGYHIPTDEEWTKLTDYLGGVSEAGPKMKIYGSEWKSYCIDSYGFSARPGGDRDNIGAFNNFGNFGSWWSSTEDDATYAWSRFLSAKKNDVSRAADNKHSGFSVRCLRD